MSVRLSLIYFIFLDEDAKNEHLIKMNQALKIALINEANEKIAILQDIIDLDMQESDEEAQLKQ
ncbi:hypothetical protein A9G35_01110 [Gilliamella sp. Choc5-1]|uniref:tail fiber assembly protein n=1 Tax=Gilliamella sp. Choc5-1 TaxID=3120238 RepID=UPI00080E5EDD|nr:tail fiber assembly protein [Gilliamella apicola]OCG48804.1 hypothetical protein A9G35_01110 [Gilliamella apicola]